MKTKFKNKLQFLQRSKEESLLTVWTQMQHRSVILFPSLLLCFKNRILPRVVHSADCCCLWSYSLCLKISSLQKFKVNLFLYDLFTLLCFTQVSLDQTASVFVLNITSRFDHMTSDSLNWKKWFTKTIPFQKVRIEVGLWSLHVWECSWRSVIAATDHFRK